MTPVTLDDWLSVLDSRHARAIDLGLDRVRVVADMLALTTLNCPVITVGGTNGKGSTVTVLTAVYRAAGYRVGTYMSPHISRFNERVALQGEPVDDSTLVSAFERIEAARTQAGISLTYFEFTTLAALWIFKQAALDIVVLEVGLGGRLDAVNIVDADVAVVTSIGLDHTDWLGETREAISFEKAGIFRPGRPAIHGESDPPAPLVEHARRLGCALQVRQRDFGFHDQGERWTWWGGGEEIADLPRPALALDNVATAIAAVKAAPLAVAADALAEGVRCARLAGRAERVRWANREIVMDVAHNPHGAAFFMQQLPVVPGRTLAVFAMLADKDITGTLDSCLGRVERWFIAGLDVPRGCPADTVAPLLHERGLTVGGCYQTVGAALRAAAAASGAGDRILVFGSFYTVAAARQWLETH